MPIVGVELLRHLEETDVSLVIRRYFTESKFESLMKTQELYCANASQFVDDPLEGHLTQVDYFALQERLRSYGFDQRSRNRALEANVRTATTNRSATVVSCWTWDNSENARLWRQYGGGRNAVAIETTVGKLREALNDDFIIARVRYLDFTRDRIPKDHSLDPFFYKSVRYWREREVRVIGNMEPSVRIGSPRLVPVDLSCLVDRLIVSPFAKSPFRRRVAELAKKRNLVIDNPSICEVVRDVFRSVVIAAAKPAR